MDRTSAKDFSRHPGLLDGHVERIIAAHKAADGYMADTALRTVGLIKIPGFLGNRRQTDLQTRVADEIYVIRPGDGKRHDSLVTASKRASASRLVAGAMWPVISGLFTARHAEVAKKYYENLYLQHLTNSPDDNDEQKVFHTDTFFHA